MQAGYNISVIFTQIHPYQKRGHIHVQCTCTVHSTCTVPLQTISLRITPIVVAIIDLRLVESEKKNTDSETVKIGKNILYINDIFSEIVWKS